MLFPFGIAPREPLPPGTQTDILSPAFMPLCIYTTTLKALRYKGSNRIREST